MKKRLTILSLVFTILLTLFCACGRQPVQQMTATGAEGRQSEDPKGTTSMTGKAESTTAPPDGDGKSGSSVAHSEISTGSANEEPRSENPSSASKRETDSEEAPVQIQWGEKIVPELNHYEEFVADEGEYAVPVLFTASRTVTNFELMRLTVSEVYDDGTVFYATSPIHFMECLTSDCPLVVYIVFPGDTPAYGISYVDESDVTHRFAIEISGEDGSILLRESDSNTFGLSCGGDTKKLKAHT